MKMLSRRGLGWSAFMLFGLAFMLLGVMLALSACTPGPCATPSAIAGLWIGIGSFFLAGCTALVLRREAPAEEGS